MSSISVSASWLSFKFIHDNPSTTSWKIEKQTDQCYKIEKSENDQKTVHLVEKLSTDSKWSITNLTSSEKTETEVKDFFNKFPKTLKAISLFGRLTALSAMTGLTSTCLLVSKYRGWILRGHLATYSMGLVISIIAFRCFRAFARGANFDLANVVLSVVNHSDTLSSDYIRARNYQWPHGPRGWFLS